MHLVLFILIGLIAGALAGRVVSGHGYGALVDIVVGCLGAFLGGWMFATFMGVDASGFLLSLIVAFIGAVVLLWLVRLIAPRHA
ncbi:MAG TPA: GlsB/YeaQ/YmgE family stress response membrane protein [Candidatus Methylomirabilis sp.]|nr:GlsB/YeaQ/YmgE family stress response membrane protein [Candidatus Methylomirabilis sp.]